MKKLLVKLLLLFVPFIVVLPVLNYFYVRSNYWKAKDNVYKFNFVPDGIELANVGSSHGALHFIYDDFPEYVTFNFGLDAQRHHYSYALLRQFSEHFRKGAIVLIPISYFEITQCPSTNEIEKRRLVYYRFLKRKYMKEVDAWNFADYLRFAKFPILSAGFSMFRLYKMPLDIPAERINVFWNRTTYLDENKLKAICSKKYSVWTAVETEHGEKGFQYNFAAVCTLIDFCTAHSFVPVLYTAPITDVLNEYFEQHNGFFDTFYRFTTELQKKYPDIKYFDYSHDEEFSPKHTLFTDGDHLNVYGAKAFTARVITDLKNARVLD